MKRSYPVSVVVLAVALLGSCSGGAGGAGYDPGRDPAADLAAAVDEASASGKRILLEVGGEWCSWCHHLEDFFRRHEEHRALLHENYVVVKVNYSPENENRDFLSRYPEIRGYPHIFILESDGTLLHSQNTGLLEQGESYDPEKIRTFLEEWSG